ncbi:peptide/nickel transport system substrate-binding protein [Paenibacillus catalpae]|uniref:Peptide/nickel transport system substrate-binding protein n=1 Tax=Paenibacillus catalpae TaxID=1045775 RepID=A0A1I2D7P5_9BACL|nr:ABC transporter substrate-binding protein [Paenibacillus catalpae]SFE76538.1 peptide/nickel transport system substrate-binding protein [Paenibacillus catalpae]
MHGNSRMRSLLGLLIGIALILSACGKLSFSANTSVTAKTINIGVTYSPNAITPLSPIGQVSSYIAGLMYLPLFELDEDLAFKPMLADSITTTDHKVFTIYLNPAAKWSDGSPITADDVIFTLKLITNKQISSTYAYMFAIIEGVDSAGFLPDGQSEIAGVNKVDEHTLTIQTKAPTTLTIMRDTIGRYLLTLPKAALENEPLTAIKNGDFVQKSAVISGPYHLDSYERDQLVQMKANTAYFKGTPKISRLNFKVVQGRELADQLESGDIDLNIPSYGAIPIEDYGRIKSLSNVTAEDRPSITTQFMYINKWELPDVKQRQAISYAINREQIVNELLRGAGEPVDGLFTSYSPYLDPSIKPAGYDPQKAKSLLAESGWTPGTKLTLSVLSGDSTLEQAAHLIADQLKEVGVHADIQMVKLAPLIHKIVERDYDLGMMTVSMSLVNPLPDVAYFLQEGNPNGYSNPEVDKLLSSLKSETDEADIKQSYSRLQQIVAEEVPLLSVYATRSLGVVNNKIAGASPKDYGMFIHVEDWDVLP